MSWILAAFNAPAHVCETARGLVRQTPSSLFQVVLDGGFVAAGGISLTCHTQVSPQKDAGWVATGLGLDLQETTCRPLAHADWLQRLTNTPPNLPDNGHFAVLRWHKNADQQFTVEAFTDALGTRTLYYVHDNQGLLLTTRLDWLARLTGRQDIDYSVFGSHWLAFNQISQAAPVRGIARIGAGGRLLLKNNALSKQEIPWRPASLPPAPSPETAEARFEATLRAFTRPTLPADLSLSLGLSGGLDSRLLLALGGTGTQLHSFGPAHKADVQIARALAASMDRSHSIFHDAVPPADSCLDLLKTHLVQTQPLTAASAVLGLRYYDTLRENQLGMIDGGLGEAARRQFFNRLLRRGRGLLRSEQFDGILPYVFTQRADLFTPEITAQMEDGVVAQFREAWDALPAINGNSIEDRLDLLSIRSRLPNFFGYEQNRLDGLVLNYMPFAQPAVLDAVFALPIAARKGGRLFRKLIRRHAKSLARFPLVKGACAYPFWLPATGAFVWTRLKKKFGQAPDHSQQHAFLSALEPFVRDTLASQETRTYTPYDLQKIERQINRYYAGQKEFGGFVDWWLAFEVWRQEMKKSVSRS